MPWSSQSQIIIFKVRHFDALFKIENDNFFTQRGALMSRLLSSFFSSLLDFDKADYL